MILSQKQKCLLWLSAAEVSADKVWNLEREYGSMEGVWQAFGEKDGISFPRGMQQKLASLHSEEAIEALYDRLNRKHVHLLFEEDEAYPQNLRDISDRPYLLYYAGNINCLKLPTIGIIGTRRASKYGLQMSASLARGIAKAGICVISGLANGIDGAAHTAVLEADGVTIGVLGSGINVPYPMNHTQMLRRIAGGKGLIISEYPLDAEPSGFHFPHRNRIISGLSSGVVFVEGPIKSGGMHTVNAALVQGREVFAVPGAVGLIGSEGPHAILREGARIVTSAQDLLDDLGIAPEALADQIQNDEELSALQRNILNALKVESLDIEELSAAVFETTDRVISELGILEILGRVTREAGNRFTLPISTGR